MCEIVEQDTSSAGCLNSYNDLEHLSTKVALSVLYKPAFKVLSTVYENQRRHLILFTSEKAGKNHLSLLENSWLPRAWR